MSQENVEAVRQGSETFNAFMRGELPKEVYFQEFKEVYFQEFDPGFELHWHERQTYPEPRRVFRASRNSSSSRSNTGAPGPI